MIVDYDNLVNTVFPHQLMIKILHYHLLSAAISLAYISSLSLFLLLDIVPCIRAVSALCILCLRYLLTIYRFTIGYL